MSRRRNLERHRRSLDEIREIMDSMKTLAYLETHKIAKLLEAQRAVVSHIEAAAADLAAFHPGLVPSPEGLSSAILVVGSERGFCGDFNRRLLQELAALAAPGDALLLVVGRKLVPLLEKDPRAAAAFEGAGVSEEIPGVIDRIVTELLGRGGSEGSLALTALYHTAEAEITAVALLPAFTTRAARAFSHAPDLDLAPRELMIALTDQYLFAALQAVLHDSLMAENRRRVAHLEGAVRHLDEEAAKLAHRHNALRQEEIIEEIEVILQSAAGVAQLAGAGTEADMEGGGGEL